MAKKDEQEKKPSNDTDLENILKDLRNNELQAFKLVKHLEGKNLNDNEQNRNWCKSYAIEIIRHCKDTSESDVASVGGGIVGNAEDKIELMLAACGLLKGYAFKPNCLGERVHRYYESVHGHNSLLKGKWKGASIDKNIRDRLDDIGWELTNTLCALKNQRGGKLGLLDEVPKKLSLPKPRTIKFRLRLLHLFETIINTSGKKKLICGICMVVATISLVKIAFFNPMNQNSTHQELRSSVTMDYPSEIDTDDARDEKELKPVEELLPDQLPDIDLMLGREFEMLVTLLPKDADQHASCSSSNTDLLYAEYDRDRGTIYLRANRYSGPKFTEKVVTITITPRTSISSDVSKTFTVTVKYDPDYARSNIMEGETGDETPIFPNN